MTDEQSILPLLLWMSPAFPVGAFAYSQGLEQAVEDELIHDAATLAAWLDDLVAHGAIRADAVLLATTWRTGWDPVATVDLNELALALAPSRERRLETASQGTAFLRAVAAAWPAAALDDMSACFGDGDVAYPVAVGVAAAAHELPLLPTLEAFALAAVGNLVSAALRLGPIGQSQAQALLSALCPAVTRLAAFAGAATADDIGTCAFRADVASMRHETQYSRLFRS